MVVLVMSKTGSKKGDNRFYIRLFPCCYFLNRKTRYCNCNRYGSGTWANEFTAEDIAFILMLITYIIVRKIDAALRLSSNWQLFNTK